MPILKKSIKQDVFRTIIFYSIIILICFGILVSALLYKSFNSQIHLYLREKNFSLKYLIEGYFVKMYNYINIISSNYIIKNITSSNNKNKKIVLDFLKDFEKSDKDINYIYIGLPDGSLIINNYEPPADFNATKRPWYKIAIKSTPNISEGLPYQDIKTKEWLVSLSKVLIGNNGKINGVIAIDTSLERLVNILNNNKDKLFKSQNSFVITNKGNIIIHKDKRLVRKNIFKLTGIKAKEGIVEYKINNHTKTAVLNNIDKVKWMVITEVNKSEIIYFIFSKVFISFILVVLASILVGWALSRNLGSRIINPIIDLKKRSSIIIKGLEPPKNFQYPANEIGQIARDLEKLTKDELYQRNLKLQKIKEKLKVLSETDQLTGIYNRRKIQKELNSEYIRYKRYGNVFSIIIFDVDYFKIINDTYGHNKGDFVLKETAKLVKSNIRKADVFARWGGEEFIILCPETRGKEALNMAEKIRTIIKNHNFHINRQVTISAGIAEMSEKFSDIDKLIAHADKNLYKAKLEGRDRCIFL